MCYMAGRAPFKSAIVTTTRSIYESMTLNFHKQPGYLRKPMLKELAEEPSSLDSLIVQQLVPCSVLVPQFLAVLALLFQPSFVG